MIFGLGVNIWHFLLHITQQKIFSKSPTFAEITNISCGQDSATCEMTEKLPQTFISEL
jgi:hypothetical protein